MGSKTLCMKCNEFSILFNEIYSVENTSKIVFARTKFVTKSRVHCIYSKVSWNTTYEKSNMTLKIISPHGTLHCTFANLDVLSFYTYTFTTRHFFFVITFSVVSAICRSYKKSLRRKLLFIYYFTSMVSNPVYCLAKWSRSPINSSGVVVPQVLRRNLLWDTNMELSLRT